MALALDRLPPQNQEAEQAVLGAMLIEREAALKALEMLEPDAFYRDAHRHIFEAVAHLVDRNEPVDVVTVAEELRRRGVLEECGGASYITGLANAVPATANVEYYARLVEDRAILRRIITVAREIAQRAYEAAEPAEEILDEAEQQIFSISRRLKVRTFVSLKEILYRTYEHLETLYAHRDRVIGVPTGLFDLDDLTAGLQPSDLIILAARPAQGKTALALNIAAHSALKRKIPVAIFSLEMSGEQVAMRLISYEAKIDGQRLRTGLLEEEDWLKITRAIARLSEAPIFVDDTPNIGILELRAKARRLKADQNIGLVIVDYLQLMQARGRGENRQQEISEISRSLKALARELRVPVLALSQLSRAVEQRQDRRPQLSDLRESGAIEQDADVVAFIYQNPELQERHPNVVELILAKQRNGPTGSVQVIFNRGSGRFENLERRLGL